MITSTNIEGLVGRHCKLRRPVRDHEGRNRFSEQPRILREVNNLDRRMYLDPAESEAPHPVLSLAVPLHVDAKAAQNWDEAH